MLQNIISKGQERSNRILKNLVDPCFAEPESIQDKENIILLRNQSATADTFVNVNMNEFPGYGPARADSSYNCMKDGTGR